MVKDDAPLPCVVPLDADLAVEDIKNFLNAGFSGTSQSSASNMNTLDTVSVGKPFGIQIYQAQSIEETSSYHNVPPVNEDTNQCLPGSFARSISWLDQTYNLNVGKTAQEIYEDLVKIMGIELGLNTGKRIKEKRKYLKDLVEKATNGKKSAVTKVRKDGDLCTWMLKEMKTEDVEFAWYWLPQGNGGHAVTVSKITKLKNGDCEISFRDDVHGGDNQGDGKPDSGRDKVGILTPDGYFGGKGIGIGITALGISESLPVIVDFFEAIYQNGNHEVIWKTGSEQNNSGFHIWRGIKNDAGDYEVTSLKEFGHTKQINPEPNENCSAKIQGQLRVDNSGKLQQPISAIGNSAESTCYSFTDTSNLSDGTYYYLLEDISDDGKRTFHCDHIDAVTVGQGSAIDLQSAINYCKAVTGSDN
ncbi:MAG: hypothetical protein HC877_08840 [Thioploca sp.]|nr:hypothetical protein [Thioploca sp.]